MSKYKSKRQNHLESARSYLNDPKALRDGKIEFLRDALFNIIDAIELSAEKSISYGNDNYGSSTMQTNKDVHNGKPCLGPNCYICDEEESEIEEENKNISPRELELAKIVKRCGGWQTEDGHWVQGFDTVEYSGGDHAITVRNTADSVPENQRHLYTKTLICPDCGTVMWTTACSGTFCRECIRNITKEELGGDKDKLQVRTLPCGCAYGYIKIIDGQESCSYCGARFDVDDRRLGIKINKDNDNLPKEDNYHGELGAAKMAQSFEDIN